MRITVIGTGYVGLVQAALLAKLGHEVLCADIDKHKIERLRQGFIPIYEPGLEELVRDMMARDRLFYSTEVGVSVNYGEIIFLCVGTPSRQDGSADLSYIDDAAAEIGRHIRTPKIVVTKSTVPVGTAERVEEIIRSNQERPVPFEVVSNPEFLREGSALQDALNGDRIVIGARTLSAFEQVASCYSGLDIPLVFVDPSSAEIIKYASNAFLATKISFINSIAELCEKTGADVSDVARGMGMDRRIGGAFLSAGLGYGGSCFPKDVKALIHTLDAYHCDSSILKAVEVVNYDQVERFTTRLRDALGAFADRKIFVMGLAFKPNTDDMREARSTEIIKRLATEGAIVYTHDPVVMQPQNVAALQVGDPMEGAEHADAIVIVTEWPEYKTLDWPQIADRMRNPILFDGRNLLEPEEMRRAGFEYYSIGRV